MIEPWKDAKNPVEATINTQNTYNGIIPEREKLMQKYFGISFMDIFKHEIFKWEVENHHLVYSQEFVVFLIEKVYPNCKPLNHLPKEIIKERETFYGYGGKPDREINPSLHLRGKRWSQYYNNKYGEGRFESKYGAYEVNKNAKAAPWDWKNFQYK